MQIEKFSPAKAEIQTAIKETRELSIEKHGLDAVKSGKKKLADLRIAVTKFGKKQREEAIAWQKEVLRQEKELTGMIEPVESKLKTDLEEYEEKKKLEERRVLLPSRKQMLEGIEIKLLDAEILRIDEKEFAAYYGEKRLEYDQEQQRKKEAEEAEKRQKEEMEKAKKEAAEQAKKEAEEKAQKEKEEAERWVREELKRKEREQREAIEKIKREQEEKERKRKEAEEKKVKQEQDRIAAKKADDEQARKNKKYQEFCKRNGFDGKTKGLFYVQRDGNTFILFKKIDQITI